MTEPRANGDDRAAELDFRRFREQGDAAALGRVFDRLAPELLLVATHVAGRTAAEDLVQATFLQAITAAANWDAKRPLMPWLIGVLANLARRDREKAQRHVDGARVPALAAAMDPHTEAEMKEVAQLVGGVLKAMPRHYRQALTLRLVHGLEPLAIAQAIGAPVATVKSRLQRGNELLKRCPPACGSRHSRRGRRVPWMQCARSCWRMRRHTRSRPRVPRRGSALAALSSEAWY